MSGKQILHENFRESNISILYIYITVVCQISQDQSIENYLCQISILFILVDK